MDLICTIYTPSKKDVKSPKGPLQSKWSYESANLCSVSSQNTLLFVSSFPLESSCNAAFSDFSSAMPGSTDPSGQPTEKLNTFGSKSGKVPQLSNDGSASNCLHHIFVADLNTPWDVHRVTSRASEITTLLWEPESASAFLLADKDGTIEIWQMNEHVITEWKCIVRVNQFPAEMFIKAHFIPSRRKAYLNLDKLDSVNFSDKFTFRPSTDLSGQFGRRDLTCCVLVSHTGLAVALAFPMGQDLVGDGGQDSGRSINTGLRVCSKSLTHSRCRIKHADIGFLKDGTLLAATSNGDPKSQVRFFSLIPDLLEIDEKHSLNLKVETFPGLFLQSPTLPGSKGLTNDEDSCQAIVGLRFVNGDDCDTILVASHHPSGGRVELWELREIPHSTNKIFQMGLSEMAQAKKINIPTWHYVEVFTGPAAQVVSLSTPVSAFQTGRGAACYVTIAYSDGSIQCLLRDSLQQIGSADLPKTGNLCEEPSSKMARASVTICDMNFTATGNALVVIDSLGQLYVYRMSPISDPGGLHSPSNLVTMLEYCLVSGYDWWDLTICAKPAHLEPICTRLTEDFNRQPQALQQLYWSRFMTIKSSMLRLSLQSPDHQSGDTHMMLMLQSIHQVFRGLIRPGDVTLSDQSVMEKISYLLSNNKSSEADVDKLVSTFHPFSKELHVEAKYLQPFQHLIQWVTNLALHLMASVPELNHRKVPGMSLASDKRALVILRELLLLIRIWGSSREAILPIFTRMTESFDVIGKVFGLLTRFKENPSDETLQDECIMLPSHVIIPPINTAINPKGISPIVVVSHNLSPIAFEFSGNDIFDAQHCSGVSSSNSVNSNVMSKNFIDGGLASQQVMDCVRQIYLGRRPYAVKQCTRCCSMTLPISSVKDALNPSWEKRWFRKCPCGGPWKLACLEE